MPSAQIGEGLERGGVELRTGVTATAASRGAGGQVSLSARRTARNCGATSCWSPSAAAPRTSDLGLETAGVAAGGYLEVDDQLRVGGSDWLYAIGDVNGRSLLTHMGKYQARIAPMRSSEGRRGNGRPVGSAARRVHRAAGRGRRPDPRGGARSGIAVQAVDVATSANAGASFVGRNAPGTSRLVIDEERRLIVGATFVGPEIAESLHAATIAVAGEVPLERLVHAVPAFPTRSEVWLTCSRSTAAERTPPTAGGRGARVRPRAGCRGRGSRSGGRAAACLGRAPVRPSPASP